MPEPEEQKKGFWTSLPGIFTALAGLLGAVAAIIGLFVVPGGSGGGSDGGDSGASHADLVRQADQLCSQTADLIRQLPPLDPNGSNFTVVVPAMSRDVRSLVEKLRALDAPEDDQQKLAQLTGLMEQQSNEADGMVVAISQQDQASFQSHQQQVVALDPQVNGAALALGAHSCAQTLAPTGLL
jgi:hypothetical protein